MDLFLQSTPASSCRTDQTPQTPQQQQQQQEELSPAFPLTSTVRRRSTRKGQKGTPHLPSEYPQRNAETPDAATTVVAVNVVRRSRRLAGNPAVSPESGPGPIAEPNTAPQQNQTILDNWLHSSTSSSATVNNTYSHSNIDFELAAFLSPSFDPSSQAGHIHYPAQPQPARVAYSQPQQHQSVTPSHPPSVTELLSSIESILKSYKEANSHLTSMPRTPDIYGAVGAGNGSMVKDELDICKCLTGNDVLCRSLTFRRHFADSAFFSS